MKRPLLALSACVGAGALVGCDVSVPWAWLLVALGASLLVLACAVSSPAGAVAALAACAVAIGSAAASAERAEDEATPLKRWLATAAEGPVRIVGRAADDAQDQVDRWSLALINLSCDATTGNGALATAGGLCYETAGPGGQN